MQVTTNEWLNTEYVKPWRGRTVLVHFEDGEIGFGVWNGMYWTAPNFMNRIDRVRHITHFYIFERFNENNVI